MRTALPTINRWMMFNTPATYQCQSNQPVVDAKLQFRHSPSDDTHYKGNRGQYCHNGYGCHNLRSTTSVEPWECFGADGLGRQSGFCTEERISADYSPRKRVPRKASKVLSSMQVSGLAVTRSTHNGKSY